MIHNYFFRTLITFGLVFSLMGFIPKEVSFNTFPITKNNSTSITVASTTIVAVYFAQTHVVKPDYLVPGVNEKFKLISNRETLVKVHVTSPDGGISSLVKAILNLNGNTKIITLTGPSNFPISFNANIGEVDHNFNDSFTGIIPKEWVQPGLTVTIETVDDVIVYNNLTIGAPNKMIMNHFQINAYTEQDSEYPLGWEQEFSEKFPTSEFIVQNIRKVFKYISIPPHNNEKKAARVSNETEYKQIVGFDFVNENDTSTEWKTALRDAAGRKYGDMVYNHVGWKFEKKANKGVGGGYSSVSRRGPLSLGILLHEAGHALSLPHWGSSYPYKGDMYGILDAGISGGIHSGPTWYYDKIKNKFIPPYQSGVFPLKYKNDPMNGGGDKFKEPGFLSNHFSDYSVNQMRKMLENTLVVYNESLGSYAKWSNSTNSYSVLQTNTGNVTYPVQRDVDVISVMAAVSATTPQANLIYEPIGPYKSGLIAVFDPRNSSDRLNAKNFFCPSGGCDITLKIQQGTNIKYVMLPMALDSSLSEFNSLSFHTNAVNLPAIDGEVLKVELLDTPNAEINGLPATPIVLDIWQSSILSDESQNLILNEEIKLFFGENQKLKIDGFKTLENATLKIFSVTGSEIFNTDFYTQKSNEFFIPNIAKGFYVIQIISDSYKFSKKIML